MSDRSGSDHTFDTVAMAQILLDQNMLEEAASMVRRIVRERPDDPRTAALEDRLRLKLSQGEEVQIPVEEEGRDGMDLVIDGSSVRATWELTDKGLGIARRQVRYSGHIVMRMFSAYVGPRGVRKTVRDTEVLHRAATMEVTGLLAPSVHVAAIGFLGRNGAFVPLARSHPVTSES